MGDHFDKTVVGRGDLLGGSGGSPESSFPWVLAKTRGRVGKSVRRKDLFSSPRNLFSVFSILPHKACFPDLRFLFFQNGLIL